MSSITPLTTAAPTVSNVVYDSDTVDFNIRRLNNFNIDLNANIKEHADNPKFAEWKVELKKNQDELATWESRKVKP